MKNFNLILGGIVLFIIIAVSCSKKEDRILSNDACSSLSDTYKKIEFCSRYGIGDNMSKITILQYEDSSIVSVKEMDYNDTIKYIWGTTCPNLFNADSNAFIIPYSCKKFWLIDFDYNSDNLIESCSGGEQYSITCECMGASNPDQPGCILSTTTQTGNGTWTVCCSSFGGCDGGCSIIRHIINNSSNTNSTKIIIPADKIILNGIEYY